MDESQETKPSYAVAMSYRDMIGVLLLGAVAGLLMWGIGLVLNRYVFDVFFCQNGAGSQCAHAVDYAAGTALVVVSVLALGGLIRLRIYRPLLIVLATVISLWGIVQLAWGTNWYWGALISVAVYMLAFGVYAWIARTRTFWMALVATLVLVVAVRLALSL